ncbi:MAG: nitroreductase family protein [Muribaculaceae bacterium]|nr:nitroreductase family protein [Muribaculaceae bacterium]MDE6540930.1 nitroreductase family protein [Muribaculaceae bacterium]
MENNDAITNILTRASNRRFNPEIPVTDSQIETLLRAAMAAPTAVNKRPWHFVVVRDRALLDGFGTSLPYCHMAKYAPAAIVVCGDSRRFLEGENSTIWVQDLSAASENILLAAHAMGLGAVWTSVYPYAERVEAVRKLVDMSPLFVPFNVIPVGHSASPRPPMDKWDPSCVTYL